MTVDYLAELHDPLQRQHRALADMDSGRLMK